MKSATGVVRISDYSGMERKKLSANETDAQKTIAVVSSQSYSI